ncbi:response regulator [Ciceribacter sp. L1K23]|uniref:histidine kinase dimerization/phosphoacceptor domain -containing protein n=1 Tax=unclassified Ciceribacter TaxID=2628820 RepID=UPI001ABE7981|nr:MULTISPECIES: histidine kinase dimerization/phosphoacceptor domain -containing protein [unclassified Ciceribacter]MBO3758768.1 response regulator [Ciceribacter sp. L1K22]MBR0557282.1 response regulator [Ciceribacter sp. L1K23]
MSVRILYLDDDAAFVRLVQKSLGRLGHVVLHAEDLDTAMRHLSEHAFDAIVLDHYLRNTTGHEILDHLRTGGVTTPVVYVTGSNEASIAINAMKAGAADYVIKSVSDDFLHLLSSAIEQTVANARLRAEKERADEEIRQAKERAEALLAEVNHRVANSLALVASLLRLQIANSPSEEVKAELAETQARITAIAGMHRSLYTSDDVSRVEMDRYLRGLTSQIAETMQRSDHRIQLVFSADPIVLSADRAVTVGMVVTELATNAFKYAYPDGQQGEIRVSLRRTGENDALLRVEDDGIGIVPNSAPTGTGLGSRIVKSMAASLGAGIQYVEKSGGTIAEVPLKISVMADAVE